MDTYRKQLLNLNTQVFFGILHKPQNNLKNGINILLIFIQHYCTKWMKRGYIYINIKYMNGILFSILYIFYIRNMFYIFGSK